MSTGPDHDTEAEQEAESRRDAAALEPTAAEAELVRSVSPVLMARRLLQAERTLAAAKKQAEEWAALAPPDDWGETPADTVAADCGRAVLAIIGSEEESDVP